MTTTFDTPTFDTTGAIRIASTDPDIIRVLANDALAMVAGEDPDRFGSDTAAGRALLSLAARARFAAATRGADSGTPLTAGPGVVVVRDLVAAVRLLDSAVAARP
jgi:hypothetical protein